MSATLTQPTQAEDAIWTAVEAAISEHMTATQFRNIVAEAWRQVAERELSHQLRELRGEEAR